MIIFLKEKMINLKTSIKKKKSIALIQGLAKYRTWVYILPLNFCLNPKLAGKIHVCASDWVRSELGCWVPQSRKGRASYLVDDLHRRSTDEDHAQSSPRTKRCCCREGPGREIGSRDR